MARILVIDDEKTVQTTIQLMLEREGFEVEVAENGHAGVAAMERAAFDLVIVDIFMPGMDGLETIMAFRRTVPSVPIIAISGSVPRHSADTLPDFLRMATKFGAVERLHKPFRSQELLQVVRKCLSARHNKIERLRPHVGSCATDAADD